MMKFNKTEKLLLFAFGCSDRAETFCRLGAVSGAVQCEPFTEQCEALRKKLQVHQETERGRESERAGEILEDKFYIGAYSECGSPDLHMAS